MFLLQENENKQTNQKKTVIKPQSQLQKTKRQSKEERAFLIYTHAHIQVSTPRVTQYLKMFVLGDEKKIKDN